MTVEHFRELECAAALVADGPGHSLASALHRVTQAYRGIVEAAHAEAIQEDEGRTAQAESKRERDAVLAARPLAEKATELRAHVYAQIDKLAPGLLVNGARGDTWARTAHANRYQRLRVEVTPAYRGVREVASTPAKIELIGDVSGMVRHRFPVKPDGSFNVALVVKRLRGVE
jgi:hypothetical protein